MRVSTVHAPAFAVSTLQAAVPPSSSGSTSVTVPSAATARTASRASTGVPSDRRALRGGEVLAAVVVPAVAMGAEHLAAVGGDGDGVLGAVGGHHLHLPGAGVPAVVLAVVTVDDDGAGVPAADRERIFERFARPDDARARDDGGAGLGRAVVRDVAVPYGGTLTVGDAPAGGARFELRPPVLGDARDVQALPPLGPRGVRAVRGGVPRWA